MFLPHWISTVAFPKFLIKPKLDPNKIEFLREIYNTKLHMNFFCCVCNLIKGISSTLKLTQPQNNRVMLLYTSPFTDSQIFLIFLSTSPHRSTAIHPWIRCYLSIISSKKLISKFNTHREFYGIGEE